MNNKINLLCSILAMLIQPIVALEQNINKLKWIHCSKNRTSYQLMFDFEAHIEYTRDIIPSENKLTLHFPGIKIINFNPKEVMTSLQNLKEHKIIQNLSLTENSIGVSLSFQFSPTITIDKKTTKNELVIGLHTINDQNNHKLVLDICPNDLLKQTSTVYYANNRAIKNKKLYAQASSRPIVSDSTEIIPPLQKRKNDWRIIIDAGHGGKDHGASSSCGIKEKDLTLSIARSLTDRLTKEGYNAHLSRASDDYLAPLDRTAYAHQLNADLFISIHLNSGKHDISGIETFYMKNQTKDDSQTRDYLFINQEAQDSLIALAETSLRETLDNSKHLASNIHSRMLSNLALQKHVPKDRGIKQYNYRLFLGNLLLSKGVPTAIVEVGFITNKDEVKLLSTKTYQQTIIDGITNGINSYVQTHSN